MPASRQGAPTRNRREALRRPVGGGRSHHVSLPRDSPLDEVPGRATWLATSFARSVVASHNSGHAAHDGRGAPVGLACGMRRRCRRPACGASRRPASPPGIWSDTSGPRRSRSTPSGFAGTHRRAGPDGAQVAADDAGRVRRRPGRDAAPCYPGWRPGRRTRLGDCAVPPTQLGGAQRSAPLAQHSSGTVG